MFEHGAPESLGGLDEAKERTIERPHDAGTVFARLDALDGVARGDRRNARAGGLGGSDDAGDEILGGEGTGRVVDEDGALDPETWVTSLSQEHGIVNRRLPVGTRLRILPNHSCLVVPNFERYHVVRDGRVVERWDVLRA